MSYNPESGPQPSHPGFPLETGEDPGSSRPAGVPGSSSDPVVTGGNDPRLAPFVTVCHPLSLPYRTSSSSLTWAGGFIEVPWVLILGICLDLHYFLTGVMFPKTRLRLQPGCGSPSSGGAVIRSTICPTRTWRFPHPQHRSTCGYGSVRSCEEPLTFSAKALS